MKRLLTLLLMLVGAWSAMGQDRIVKLDASSVEAKVLEISPEEVSYKRFTNLEGPTYRLPVTQIAYIVYANGERDDFNPLSATDASTQAPAVAPTSPANAATASDTPTATTPVETTAGTPSATTVSSAPRYILKTYAVGDYYDYDGVKGVVIATSDDGQHGLLLSLDQATLKWDTLEKGAEQSVGTASKSDGLENMAALEQYLASHGLDWGVFPAFAWCKSLGEGWYLPAIDEWLTISFNFNGGSRTTFNRTARNKVNDTLKAHGGKRLDRMMYYFSSTEQDARMALAGHMAVEPPYVEPLKKNGITYFVRAVRKF